VCVRERVSVCVCVCLTLLPWLENTLTDSDRPRTNLRSTFSYSETQREIQYSIDDLFCS